MIRCIFENGKQANNISLRHVVVDVLVLKENKILLEKRADSLLEGGKWALVGGFMEMGETAQDAVKRETFEETGYTIDNLQLLTIRDNPNRQHEDRQNVSLVYICEAVDKKGTSDWEVQKQKWFALDALPDPASIAFDHYLNIELFLKYKKEHLKLPVLQ